MIEPLIGAPHINQVRDSLSSFRGVLRGHRPAGTACPPNLLACFLLANIERRSGSLLNGRRTKSRMTSRWSRKALTRKPLDSSSKRMTVVTSTDSNRIRTSTPCT